MNYWIITYLSVIQSSSNKTSFLSSGFGRGNIVDFHTPESKEEIQFDFLIGLSVTIDWWLPILILTNYNTNKIINNNKVIYSKFRRIK